MEWVGSDGEESLAALSAEDAAAWRAYWLRRERERKACLGATESAATPWERWWAGVWRRGTGWTGKWLHRASGETPSRQALSHVQRWWARLAPGSASFCGGQDASHSDGDNFAADVSSRAPARSASSHGVQRRPCGQRRWPPVESFLCEANARELVEVRGYPCEEHVVETEDGYLLTVFRIPHGRRGDDIPQARRPVLLMPGFMESCEIWVCRASHLALPFLLAERGFDVWLANLRGSKYGCYHRIWHWHGRPVATPHRRRQGALPGGVGAVDAGARPAPQFHEHLRGRQPQHPLPAVRPAHPAAVVAVLAPRPAARCVCVADGHRLPAAIRLGHAEHRRLREAPHLFAPVQLWQRQNHGALVPGDGRGALPDVRLATSAVAIRRRLHRAPGARVSHLPDPLPGGALLWRQRPAHRYAMAYRRAAPRTPVARGPLRAPRLSGRPRCAHASVPARHRVPGAGGCAGTAGRWHQARDNG
eukprot:ctg_1481.g431